LECAGAPRSGFAGVLLRVVDGCGAGAVTQLCKDGKMQCDGSGGSRMICTRMWAGMGHGRCTMVAVCRWTVLVRRRVRRPVSAPDVTCIVCSHRAITGARSITEPKPSASVRVPAARCTVSANGRTRTGERRPGSLYRSQRRTAGKIVHQFIHRRRKSPSPYRITGKTPPFRIRSPDSESHSTDKNTSLR